MDMPMNERVDRPSRNEEDTSSGPSDEVQRGQKRRAGQHQTRHHLATELGLGSSLLTHNTS